MLWVWKPLLQSWRGILITTFLEKVCMWLVECWWFSSGTPVFSTNKTDRHDITEILLKVALNTINQINLENWIFERILHVHILSLLHKATLVTDGLILCNIKMVHFLCRILVGAPRDFDQSWSPSIQTGALYKCDPVNTSSCQQINIAKSGKF
jgi:hypothetical protein